MAACNVNDYIAFVSIGVIIGITLMCIIIHFILKEKK